VAAIFSEVDKIDAVRPEWWRQTLWDLEMSNPLGKQERGGALVCGTRKGHGRFPSRLTTPLRRRAFFALALCDAWRPPMAKRSYDPVALLYEADQRFHAGDQIGAACYCRAALFLYLRRLCRKHNCRPNFEKRSGRGLSEPLQRCGALSRLEAWQVYCITRRCNYASWVTMKIRPAKVAQAIRDTRKLLAVTRIAVLST
jgi:hypothetical protein